MFRTITLLFILHASLAGYAQSIGEINFADRYQASLDHSFQTAIVRHHSSIKIYYTLSTTDRVSDYQITWEKRESFDTNAGSPVSMNEEILEQTNTFKKGVITNLEAVDDPWLLVATITSWKQESWTYFVRIENNYPVNGIATSSEGLVNRAYIRTGESLIFSDFDQSTLYGYYYGRNFTSAFPPFAEEIPGTSQLFLTDSTFQILNGQTLSFSKEGLYLIQTDTTGSEGLSFRVVNSSYPKITRVSDLAGPVAYITTQEEYNKLLSAPNDKSTFDQVVLSITGNSDRARRFIRNYFQRVESANQYFTSFKEGWKTDRGLIYTIFGPPDSVTRSDNIESWYYQNSGARYTFVRAGTVFAPNHYVLIRDKKYTETWYSTIDQWRKGRL